MTAVFVSSPKGGGPRFRRSNRTRPLLEWWPRECLDRLGFRHSFPLFWVVSCVICGMRPTDHGLPPTTSAFPWVWSYPVCVIKTTREKWRERRGKKWREGSNEGFARGMTLARLGERGEGGEGWEFEQSRCDWGLQNIFHWSSELTGGDGLGVAGVNHNRRCWWFCLEVCRRVLLVHTHLI